MQFSLRLLQTVLSSFVLFAVLPSLVGKRINFGLVLAQIVAEEEVTQNVIAKGKIEQDQSITANISGAEIHEYQLSLQAGEYLHLEVMQNTVDV